MDIAYIHMTILSMFKMGILAILLKPLNLAAYAL